MRKRTTGWMAVTCAVLSLLPAVARAEVVRVEISTRNDVANAMAFGSSGAYEELVGKIYFAVDPANPRNRMIVDLDKAPKNADGRVEMSADLAILKPKDPGKGNGVALLDIVNRGNRTVLTGFNRASGNAIGDPLLMRMGYTVVWVGWEFDVPQRAGAIRIDVPVAAGVTGTVRAMLTPAARGTTARFGDLAVYTPSDPASPQNTLSVRESPLGKPTPIPRNQWTLDGNAVTLETGFEPGKTYELSFVSANPRVGGLGFAAVRDTAAWMKHAPDALVSIKQVLAFGSSQSGRFLRTFLYQGFNADEKNRLALDAVIAHIAGASRLDLNNRWATPTNLGQFNATSFPFADVRQRDPVTGAEDGGLDNSRARDFKPKIFNTNTGVEYWGGGRAAALIHTSPDGSRDLSLPDNERVYFLAGSQHGPARFPPAPARNGEQQENPNDYWYVMRALLVAMDRWMRDDVAPPPSQYPRLRDKTLVKAGEVAFPNLPAVSSPQNLPAAPRSANPLIAQDGAPGAQLPYLVPQTDRDGIEIAGIRLPDVAVPLATYTGWNFRNKTVGGADQLYPLLGSYIPFTATAAQREQTRDPRPSIAERYSSREAYLEKVQKGGAKLVSERYLLADDLKVLVDRAGRHWDLLVGN